MDLRRAVGSTSLHSDARPGGSAGFLPRRWRPAVLGLLAVALLAAAPGAQAGTWRRLETTGLGPSERSTPGVAPVLGGIYVFGGVKDDFSTFTNTFYDDLYRFDPATHHWTPLAPAGSRPPGRAFAGSVGHPARGLFLIFGGASYAPDFSDFVAYDDLWAYSVVRNTWTRLQAVNAGPEGRSRPNMWQDRDKLYVFGGITSFFSVKNDLWMYDFSTNAWTELIPDGAAGSPPPRHEALAGQRATFFTRKLIIYGGETFDFSTGFQLLSDTWELDLDTNTWTDVTPPPERNVQPPRNYGSAAVIGTSLYMQGGDTPDGSAGCGAPFPQNPQEELWRFESLHRTWTRLTPSGDALPRIKRTNAAAVAGKMYVFAGYDFQCQGDVGPGQVWNLDVFSYNPFH